MEARRRETSRGQGRKLSCHILVCHVTKDHLRMKEIFEHVLRESFSNSYMSIVVFKHLNLVKQLTQMSYPNVHCIQHSFVSCFHGTICLLNFMSYTYYFCHLWSKLCKAKIITSVYFSKYSLNRSKHKTCST